MTGQPFSAQSTAPSEPMAVLFGYDPATGEHTADPLIGLHSSGMDPITWAHALQDSVESDFPGWLWSITGNDPALELRRQAQVEAVLGKASDVEECASPSYSPGVPSVSEQQSSLSAWRFMVVYEINGKDMDAASDKLEALDKAAKKLGIAAGLVDGSGPPHGPQ